MAKGWLKWKVQGRFLDTDTPDPETASLAAENLGKRETFAGFLPSVLFGGQGLVPSWDAIIKKKHHFKLLSLHLVSLLFF